MNKIARYEAESRTIVYIDESGFAHDMPRRHGYIKRIWAYAEDTSLNESIKSCC